MSGRRVVLAAEDEVSMAILLRLVEAAGHLQVDRRQLARGFGQLKAGIEKFKAASRVLPHIVLTDLDRHPCVPALFAAWKVGRVPEGMLLRVAVREVEAWLLADREGMAELLGVPVGKLPEHPEYESDPKQRLVNIARRSRTRLAKELVPEPGSVAPIGPGYNARLCMFVRDAWNLDAARRHAPSLERAWQRIQTFGSRLY